MATDSTGRVVRRYTVSFGIVRTNPRESHRKEVRAATSLGVHKAVSMATARLLRLDPDVRFAEVDVINVEVEFTIDPENDALDYHGGFD